MNTYLVRRNPVSVNNVFAMSRAMDRLVRDAFGESPVRGATPALEIVENDAVYTIKAALPGWSPEQVDISFEDGVITLKGEIAEAADTAASETEKVHVREFRQESFVRRFSLPVEVDADKATAEFSNGILTLSIPKAETVKPKQIRIAAK
jgi:HSP20 family protein